MTKKNILKNKNKNKAFSSEAEDRLERLQSILFSLNVSSTTVRNIVDNVKDEIKPKRPKKLTARELSINAMNSDEDRIMGIPDSMMFIIKYTATCFKYGFDLPFSNLVHSSKEGEELDYFQFAVSALEHNLNPKMIKNCDRIRIYEYAPDCSMAGKFGDKLSQAMLGPCRDLVSERLSKIDPTKLNVGTEQDILDFKRRHGLK